MRSVLRARAPGLLNTGSRSSACKCGSSCCRVRSPAWRRPRVVGGPPSLGRAFHEHWLQRHCRCRPRGFGIRRRAVDGARLWRSTCGWQRLEHRRPLSGCDALSHRVRPAPSRNRWSASRFRVITSAPSGTVAWRALADPEPPDRLDLGAPATRSRHDALRVTLALAISSGIAILLVGLGEMLAERVGVLNIGLEGIMLMGAVGGFMQGCTPAILLGY